MYSVEKGIGKALGGNGENPMIKESMKHGGNILLKTF